MTYGNPKSGRCEATGCRTPKLEGSPFCYRHELMFKRFLHLERAGAIPRDFDNT